MHHRLKSRVFHACSLLVTACASACRGVAHVASLEQYCTFDHFLRQQSHSLPCRVWSSACRASSCSSLCVASDGVLRNRSVSPEHDTDSVTWTCSRCVAESVTQARVVCRSLRLFVPSTGQTARQLCAASGMRLVEQLVVAPRRERHFGWHLGKHGGLCHTGVCSSCDEGYSRGVDRVMESSLWQDVGTSLILCGTPS